jgi:hypothetical protein
VAENVPLVTGDPAVEAFFQATQEMLSGAAVRLEVVKTAAATVQVPAGPDDEQVAVSIDGRYRFIDAPINRVHPGGAAGTYDLSVTAPDNDPVTKKPPGADYSFALAITAEGVAPAGVDLHRVIRKIQWDGAAITRIDRLDGEGPARHAASHAANGSDPVTPAAIGAATAADLAAAVEGEAAARAGADAGLQPLDGDLTSFAALVSAADRLAYATGPQAWALTVFTAMARSLLDDPDAATMRATLGLALGIDVEAHDADLTALAALASAADKLPYSTGAQAWALTTLTAFARTLLDDVDAATMRTTLGLVIGTNVEAHDADLTALAALASAADKLPYSTGAQAWALTTLSAFMRTLLPAADAAAARGTLGSQKAITRSASKPVAPADGDLWIYPASAPYCEWLMRYDAAAALWKYVGGNPVQVGTWNTETRPDNATWGDTATVLSYTVPFAGSYAIEATVGLAWPSNYGCELDASVNPRGLGAAGPNGAAVSPVQGGEGAAIPVPLQWWSGFVAGDTIKLQYFASQQGGGGYTASFRYRQMYIKPLYIS